MHLLILSSGTGEPFCGGCVRDHVLARALRRLGHSVRIVPLRHPLDGGGAPETYGPLFFGANSTRLRDRAALFRHTPHALDAALDHPWALRSVAPGRPDARAMLNLLAGEDGPHAREFRRFAAWLREQLQPDAVLLSDSLCAGFAPVIRRAVKTRVLCGVRGEEADIAATGPAAAEVWKALRGLGRDMNAWIAISGACREIFTRKTRLPEDTVHTIWSGLDLDAFAPDASPPPTPVIGTLGRQREARGLGRVVAAFIELRKDLFHRAVRLRIIGACAPRDRAFVSSLRKDLHDAGLDDAVEWHTNVDDDSKAFLLRGCSLVTVAPEHPDAFGLFIPECLASGVPVVLPKSGSYPELIAATRGGVLYEPDDVPGMVAAWREVLAHPEVLAQAVRHGREAAYGLFRAERMAKETAALIYASPPR